MDVEFDVDCPIHLEFSIPLGFRNHLGFRREPQRHVLLRCLHVI